MKKILVLCLFLMLITTIAFASPSFTLVDTKGVTIDDRGFLTYIIDGTTPGWQTITTLKGYKILGYGVWIKADIYDLRVILYDDDSSAIARNLLINESEFTSTDQRPVWLPYPRKLTYGLTTYCPGGTDIIIYYTQ